MFQLNETAPESSVESTVALLLESKNDLPVGEEQLKWLPGALQAMPCILLRQNTTDANGVDKVVVQVFDNKGTWIGEKIWTPESLVTNPDYIPE
jgi:hypothetical protein